MKRNQLGSSELRVSEIGLGCMSLVPENEAEGKEILKRAYEEGITYFDTADLYQFGWNEKFVGKSIRPFRDKVVLATKVGNRWTADKKSWDWDPSKTYIKQAIKDSLHRLGTDYIDLYQLHGGTIEDNMDETISAFNELKQEGLVREYGISSIRPNVISYYAEHSEIVSVMMQYSILDRRPEEEMLDFLHNKKISVIARGPVAKGWLSERALNRSESDQYLEYEGKEIHELVKGLQDKLASERTLSQTAIRYCLHHPAVAAVIPGASSVDQLLSNVGAAHTPELSADEVAVIQSLSKASVYNQHRR
ncbi:MULTISPECIES: aldo/keto reductase [Fictibacillus]|uniref:Oxidoreductase n=1 Tax=Fictibacillus enclensis TaxID=1017270 RepID=A0A0V8JFI5_9BACL|nr:MULTISPECIES: aldo/keto reductase [Fictibacillus]KSU85656.1 oxidoreductase [Fictibacillus enclensis]RXY98649.1 aldo/keto reductase [Fictibacillus sp. S7]SCC00419.1 Predicted oxidoreductase [Fictibacillus enclensis]